MAKVKVKLSSSGVSALLNDPGVRADMLARAERVAATARAGAPVDSGGYQASMSAWSDTTDRAVGRAGSSARHAPVVEASTGNLVRALGSGA